MTRLANHWIKALTKADMARCIDIVWIVGKYQFHQRKRRVITEPNNELLNTNVHWNHTYPLYRWREYKLWDSHSFSKETRVTNESINELFIKIVR